MLGDHKPTTSKHKHNRLQPLACFTTCKVLQSLIGTCIFIITADNYDSCIDPDF